MIAPLIAVTVLALAGGTFGAWRHNHVTAIASAPTSTAPSPHLVAVPISAPVAETAPTAAAPVKELAPKPEAAKFAAEKKDEPAEVTPIPAAMIRVAAAHTKVDSTAVDAPSLNLIAGGALPQLPAPKAVSALLAVKKSIAIPAALVQSVAPAYPEIARRNGIGGEVHVQMTVTTAGKVSAVRAVSGPAMLRAAATNAVSQWQYRPATLDGRAIDSTVDVMVKFAAAR